MPSEVHGGHGRPRPELEEQQVGALRVRHSEPQEQGWHHVDAPGVVRLAEKRGEGERTWVPVELQREPEARHVRRLPGRKHLAFLPPPRVRTQSPIGRLTFPPRRLKCAPPCGSVRRASLQSHFLGPIHTHVAMPWYVAKHYGDATQVSATLDYEPTWRSPTLPIPRLRLDRVLSCFGSSDFAACFPHLNKSPVPTHCFRVGGPKCPRKKHLALFAC